MAVLVVVGGLSAGCAGGLIEMPSESSADDGEGGRIAYQVVSEDRLERAISSPEDFDPYSTEGTDIYSSDPQGGDVQRITDGGGISPSFSPDGSKVVFNKEGGIYVAEADGSGETQLTEEPSDSSPAFSPDGEFIAFSRIIEREIYTMNADGSDQKPLTDGLEELFGGFTGSLAWNPQEMEIAFSANDGGDSDIYTVDFPKGDNLQQVTDDSLENFSPAYSPDGQTIAYASSYDGYGDIYTIAADGSEMGNPTQITDSDSDDENPIFSPDGGRIAFSSGRGGGRFDIFTMDSETGADKFNVTKNSDWGGHGSPTWSDHEPSVGDSGGSDTGLDLVSSDNGEPPSEKHRTGKGEW